ncbi:ankyrin repeat domain-containing protein [Pontimicrobium sp. SW4]|uniref:Ankyrin repeat domain-containing protein n=1 Tax=Pontimicrobium sp. SW4 TaxID=3153519 RepID=A0AAU7BTK3_9FLAO
MKLINSIIICLVFIIQVNGQTTEEGLNQFDSEGKTRLIKAVSNKEFDKVKTLLQKGADVNLAEKDGLKGTALMYAVSTGDKLLCQLLLEHDANINQLDVNKDHALNWATFYGYVDIMSLLIKEGTNLSLKSKHGTAVDVALRLWHHDSVANIFRSTSLAQLITKDENKFLKAIKSENYNVFKKLLEKGVSPNLKDGIGIPIMQLASQKGDKKMIEFLVGYGADVNILNRVGQTPLTWASRFKHLEVVKYLLESGADSNKTDHKYQLTSLIGAAIGGDVSIGKLLINSKAQINHKDVINNASPLHWAIFYGNTDFAEFLINNGANYHEKALEENMYSAYDMVKNYKNEKLIRLIEEKDLQKEKAKLLGSWKVKEIHYQYSDTTYIMKTKDYGRFIFSKNSYALMYNPRMQKRVPFKNLSKPDQDEINNAFGSIVFNTGSYSINNHVIETQADIAKVPGFEGGKQFYKLHFNLEEELELIMFDETYPNGNKPEWFEKLKVKFILIKE